MKIIIFLFILQLLFSFAANDASIGVKPDKIEIKGIVGKALLREILVFNAGSAPGTYVLSADDEQGLIKIEPQEFVLEAGAERLVKISAKNYFPKTVNTNISVVSRPLDSNGLAAAAGVKVPILLQSYFSQLQIVILAFCLAMVIMILFKMKKIDIRNKIQ
jgi:hypothetical protein